MPTKVTLIPGDGIGPSITEATLRILAAAGADLEYDEQVAGVAGVTRFGDPMPECTIDSIKRTRPRAQGPARDAGGRRLPLGQRRAAQDLRPLRQRAPGASTSSPAAATTTSTSS